MVLKRYPGKPVNQIEMFSFHNLLRYFSCGSPFNFQNV